VAFGHPANKLSGPPNAIVSLTLRSGRILAVAAWLLVGHAQAATLDDANRAFAAGHYHESALDCQSVLAQNGYSAPVLFDLGNSFYREGDYAEAILAYERARWLSPHDPDIAANLQLARKQAGLPVPEPSASEKFARFLSASGWAWLGSGAWTLLCLSLLARTILPPSRSLCSFTAFAGVLVLFTAVAAMVVSSTPLRQAVVIDKNASALISPFPAAQAAFSPAPGEILTVQKIYNDFLFVKDASGHAGWISQTQIVPIIPQRDNG